MTFSEAARTWARIGLLGFGGPAGQIALMHRILVDEKCWVDEKRFLHALNYCMLLPGFFAILALSIIYATYQEAAPVAALFFGLKAATAAVVVEAVMRIGRRALGTRTWSSSRRSPSWGSSSSGCRSR